MFSLQFPWAFCQFYPIAQSFGGVFQMTDRKQNLIAVLKIAGLHGTMGAGSKFPQKKSHSEWCNPRFSCLLG
jgi:hypothetical protein